ncbi:MAG: class I SAM-dependent methyltransferase [Anaerolineales bacterium]
MDEQAFIEYLRVKKAIDDRSLNRLVWETLVASMPTASQEHPWRILEIGAGIGTMIQRLIEWNFLKYADYTALDSSAVFLAEAFRYLSTWADEQGFEVIQDEQTLRFRDGQHDIRIDFVTQELERWMQTSRSNDYFDLLIAHAFLDLVNLEETLPVILHCLKEGGIFYFTINFDGMTVFEPPLEETLDEQIISLYHRTMEEREAGEKPSAGAYSGRRLLRVLEQSGGQLLRAGASDWVVHPIEGRYPPGEGRFLRFLLQMIASELTGREEISASQLRAWLDQRIAQIEDHRLTLMVHQIDLVGRKGLTSASAF